MFSLVSLSLSACSQARKFVPWLSKNCCKTLSSAVGALSCRETQSENELCPRYLGNYQYHLRMWVMSIVFPKCLVIILHCLIKYSKRITNLRGDKIFFNSHGLTNEGIIESELAEVALSCTIPTGSASIAFTPPVNIWSKLVFQPCSCYPLKGAA